MTKKIISIILKFLIGISSITGILISFFNAKYDGYSHWSKRLLFFTGQSNLWIGILSFILAILIIIKLTTHKDCVKDWLYTLKYVFTVSITLTGFIYCCLLGPFANSSYHAWSLSSWLTHVVVPILSIADFFIDDYKYVFKKRHIWYSIIPPALYLAFCAVLGLFQVDFGRGETYPYFFLNFKSPAGIFGFSNQKPFVIGSFYWIILFLLMTLSFAFLLIFIHPESIRKRKQKKLEKTLTKNQNLK